MEKSKFIIDLTETENDAAYTPEGVEDDEEWTGHEGSLLSAVSAMDVHSVGRPYLRCCLDDGCEFVFGWDENSLFAEGFETPVLH
ncbi:MAG: hypothetical protein ACREUA_05775 [Burkholderiales bacterium]